MKSQRGSLLLYGLIALAIIAVLAGIGHSIYSAGFDAAKLECEEAAKRQRDAEAKQGNAASTTLETGNAKARIVYKTITQTVDRIVSRPIYVRVCFDDEGVAAANIALAGTMIPEKKETE